MSPDRWLLCRDWRGGARPSNHELCKCYTQVDFDGVYKILVPLVERTEGAASTPLMAVEQIVIYVTVVNCTKHALA